MQDHKKYEPLTREEKDALYERIKNSDTIKRLARILNPFAKELREHIGEEEAEKNLANTLMTCIATVNQRNKEFLPLNELFKEVVKEYISLIGLPEDIEERFASKVYELIDGGFRRDSLTGISPRTYQALSRDLFEYHAHEFGAHEFGEERNFAFALAGDVSNLGRFAEKLGPEITSLLLRRMNEIVEEELKEAGAKQSFSMNTFGTDEMHYTVMLNANSVEEAEQKLEEARKKSVDRILELMKELGIDQLEHPKYPGNDSRRGVSFAFAFGLLDGKPEHTVDEKPERSRDVLDHVLLEKWIDINKAELAERKAEEAKKPVERTPLAVNNGEAWPDKLTRPFNEGQLGSGPVDGWIEERLRSEIKTAPPGFKHPLHETLLELKKPESGYFDFEEYRRRRSERTAANLLEGCDEEEKCHAAIRYFADLYEHFYHARDPETQQHLPTHKSDRSQDIAFLGIKDSHMLRFSPSNFSGLNAVLPNAGTNYIFAHICDIAREEFEKAGVKEISYRTGGRDSLVLVQDCPQEKLDAICFSIWQRIEEEINGKTLGEYIEFQKARGHKIIINKDKAVNYLNSKGVGCSKETLLDVKISQIPHQRKEKENVRGVGLDIAAADLDNLNDKRASEVAARAAGSTRGSMIEIGETGKGGLAYLYGGKPVADRSYTPYQTEEHGPVTFVSFPSGVTMSSATAPQQAARRI